MTCNGCRFKEELATLDVEKMVQEQLDLETDLVDEVTATSRRTICCECNQLENSICKVCGCYVEFRLNLAFKSCPKKMW